MTLALWHVLVLVPVLVLIEGFFSGSEIALLSADKLALKALARHGSHGAKSALELARHPERVLSATLFMTSLCVISNSALIALYFIAHGSSHPDLKAILVTSPIIVLFGELVPKTIYQRYAEQIAPWVAPPVEWTYRIFYPITRILSGYNSRLSKIVGPLEELFTGKRRTTREELRSMISYSKSESTIKTSEKRMIKRIFDFRDTEAKHALIPLVKVDAIEESTQLRNALESFLTHRHSRMPVYSERIDNIVGIIEFSELIGAIDLELPIKNYIAPAHYVAETQALEDVIREMRLEGNEMTVVVDEYGGAVGILTFEDIVEEIVGEISDEYDTELLAYKEMSDTSWLVQARTEIQQINEHLHLELPEGEYETLGGFLLQQFGRIPEVRDELYFDTPHGSLRFTIRRATNRYIQTVLIERLSGPKESNE